jgi:hypothetical protein
MAGYIGANTSSVTNNQNAAERRKKFTFTAATTSLTGLNFAPAKIHIFHNGIRLVKDTDFTEAADGKSVTLTNAAQAGDEVVAVTFAQDPASNTDFVSAATGGTFSGDVTMASGTTFDASAGLTTPAGHVIQTVNTLSNTKTSITSTSYVACTDLTASITPKFASSKLLVTYNAMLRTYKNSGADSSVKVGISRDSGSTILAPTRTRAYDYGSSGIIVESSVSNSLLDNPATTSSLTYQIYIAFVNGTNATINNFTPDAYSSITIQEIAQ